MGVWQAVWPYGTYYVIMGGKQLSAKGHHSKTLVLPKVKWDLNGCSEWTRLFCIKYAA